MKKLWPTLRLTALCNSWRPLVLGSKYLFLVKPCDLEASHPWYQLCAPAAATEPSPVAGSDESYLAPRQYRILSDRSNRQPSLIAGDALKMLLSDEILLWASNLNSGWAAITNVPALRLT